MIGWFFFFCYRERDLWIPLLRVPIETAKELLSNTIIGWDPSQHLFHTISLGTIENYFINATREVVTTNPLLNILIIVCGRRYIKSYTYKENRDVLLMIMSWWLRQRHVLKITLHLYFAPSSSPRPLFKVIINVQDIILIRDRIE